MKTREQLEATGNKILNSVRTELYLSMRFMGPALGSLGFAMDLSTRTVGTDALNRLVSSAIELINVVAVWIF